MIIFYEQVYAELLSKFDNKTPQISCGILLGPKKGTVTELLSLRNIAANPSSDWQLDAADFTNKLAAKIKAGLFLQGFYYISRSELQPPEAVIRQWRHNVPCVLVVSDSASQPEIRAYSIDLLLKKMVRVPVIFKTPEHKETKEEKTVDEVPTVSIVAAPLGENIRTGKVVELSKVH